MFLKAFNIFTLESSQSVSIKEIESVLCRHGCCFTNLDKGELKVDKGRIGLIESPTPCLNAQMIALYLGSNPIRLTVLLAMSEDYITAT